MARAEASLLVSGLLLAGALVATGAGPLGRVDASAPEPAPDTRAADGVSAVGGQTPDEFGAVYGRFGVALRDLRGGDPAAFALLLAAAEELCRRFDRCDAVRVARYYGALSPAELAQGARAEKEFYALRKELSDANGLPLTDEDWDALRSEIRRDLDETVAQSLAQPDYLTAGRALSLIARLEVEQVERDKRLSAPEKSDLVLSAEDHARRGLQLFERAGFVTPALEPKWTLARIAFARHETARTREAYGEVYDDARHVNQAEYVVHALQGMIWLAQELGDAGEVDRLLGELARLEPPGAHWFTARKQAASLISKDEAERAIAFLNGVRPKGDLATREWHLLMGDADLRLGNLASARAHFEELLPGSVEHTVALASLALRDGRADEARNALVAQGFIEDLRSDRRAEALALLGEAELALDRPAEAVAALSEALSMADDWREHFEETRERHDPVISVVGEVLGLHVVVLLAQAHARLGNALEAARVIETHQSASFARQRLPGSAAGAALDARDLRAWAAEYELGLVTWAVGADHSVVAHVGADGEAAAWTIEFGRAQLTHGVRRLREQAIDGDAGRFERTAAKVADAILPAELRARLARRPGGDGRVLCLVHGPLEELPLEAVFALAVDAGLAPLVLPGLPERTPGAGLDALDTARWFLLGDPLAPDDALLPSLPGARDELAALADLHAGSTSLCASAFDREAVERALRSGCPLHVATHFVPGCFSRSRLAGVGMLLSGGEYFCPTEVRAAEPRLPLVVLSGCESQAGRFVDAEGLHGLARAFLESGTRNLLVTLWPVEDSAAKAYSLAFHRALAEGALPSHAARAARETLARGYSAAEWAAFRLAGRD